MNIIGYFCGIDPAACLIQDGRVVAFVEEERLVRYKHAPDIFPIRSIDFCLSEAGLTLDDIDAFAYGWDIERYSDGRMAQFYEGVNERYPPDAGTKAWQAALLSQFNVKKLEGRLKHELTRFFGAKTIPPLRFYPHHKAHAVTAFHMSPYDEALVFTIDGSGDSQCATIWRGHGDQLDLIHEVEIPHSLGWFYAAITEYLGFDAYDGEYKVMGLAAYGKPNKDFADALAKMVPDGPAGWDYEVDPKYIHHGPHTYSGRFTDHLVDLIGLPPRQGGAPLEPIHESLAFEAQRLLEDRVERFLGHFAKETGIRKICLAGGVALNVKMNGRIEKSGLFDDIFVFPIPSDSGTSIGAALGVYHEATGKRPTPLEHVYLGPGYSDHEIEQQIKNCGLEYKKCDDIAGATAELLSDGKIIAWFQGRLEGGPRALGARSILGDPRSIESRDRVNAAIKFREYWRPFCPSMLEEAIDDMMQNASPAPYMIKGFEATKRAVELCPAVVHIDNTMRVQTVNEKTNPRYYQLLKAFQKKTGVPVLLNTSLNIKGEAMACSPRDAMRIFWTTGIDALAIGNCLVEKPKTPMPLAPEEVVR